jgi:hypothetical protein
MDGQTPTGARVNETHRHCRSPLVEGRASQHLRLNIRNAADIEVEQLEEACLGQVEMGGAGFAACS